MYVAGGRGGDRLDSKKERKLKRTLLGATLSKPVRWWLKVLFFPKVETRDWTAGVCPKMKAHTQIDPDLDPTKPTLSRTGGDRPAGPCGAKVLVG